MWKSMFFKEWLKIRLIFILAIVCGTLILLGIYLNVRHTFQMADANEYWNAIINGGHIYYGLFRFVPLLVGLSMGIAQYYPETYENRLKLTLHLPLHEEKSVSLMVIPGTLALLAVFSVLLAVFIIPGTFFFPREIVVLSIHQIIPWFLAGFAIYYVVPLTIIEPQWKFKISFVTIGLLLIQLFFLRSATGGYLRAFVPLIAMIALMSTSTQFAVYRYRKGER